MTYLWGLFVITALESGGYHFEHVATYNDRATCDWEAHRYYEDNKLLLSTVECIKVDE